MQNNLKIARPALVALGLTALVGMMPAYAADVVMEEAPVAPAIPMEQPPLNTWSGAYAGVSLGYGFAGDTDVGSPYNNSIDTDGFLIGGFAGYNWQAGNMVAGVEGDVGYSWEDGSNAGLKSESGVEGSLRARLGYVISPDLLVYATAGGAAKSLEVSGGGVKDDSTMIGWTAGAGADMMMTESVFGRVEYRYTDFGNESFDLAPSADVDDKSHRITFGVGMKF